MSCLFNILYVDMEIGLNDGHNTKKNGAKASFARTL